MRGVDARVMVVRASQPDELGRGVVEVEPSQVDQERERLGPLARRKLWVAQIASGSVAGPRLRDAVGIAVATQSIPQVGDLGVLEQELEAARRRTGAQRSTDRQAQHRPHRTREQALHERDRGLGLEAREQLEPELDRAWFRVLEPLHEPDEFGELSLVGDVSAYRRQRALVVVIADAWAWTIGCERARERVGVRMAAQQGTELATQQDEASVGVHQKSPPTYQSNSASFCAAVSRPSGPS
jgi:hypothetical protein